MTAVKYELNRNCLSQSITNSGLQDVVRRTSNITTSFAQDKNKIRIRLTLALWQWHIYRCLLFWLFIYLFIYSFVRSLLNAAQRESLSPSGPKNLSHWVTSFRSWVTWHMSPSCSVKRCSGSLVKLYRPAGRSREPWCLQRVHLEFPVKRDRRLRDVSADITACSFLFQRVSVEIQIFSSTPIHDTFVVNFPDHPVVIRFWFFFFWTYTPLCFYNNGWWQWWWWWFYSAIIVVTQELGVGLFFKNPTRPRFLDPTQPYPI